MLMTEGQIEHAVERMFDALDRRLMAGALDQLAYDAEVKRIDAWAEAEYRTMRRFDR